MSILLKKTRIVSIVVLSFFIIALVFNWVPFVPAPRALALSTEILKPTSYTFSAYGTNDNPSYAYDGTTGGDSTTYNRLGVEDNRADPTIEYHTWDTSSNAHSARRLYIRRQGVDNIDDPWSISYSLNGGSSYTVIESGLTSPPTGNTPVVNISTSQDLSQLVVKISTAKEKGPDHGYAYIYDVWLECDFTGVPKVGTQIGGSYPLVVNPTTLTPQQEWTTVTVPVAHAEDLSHIDAVELKMFYDSAGNDPDESGFSSNAQTCAVFTWTRGGSPEWDIELSGTTWAINDTGCSKPSDSALQGDWVFSFKVGKVATYSDGTPDWDIYAEAIDYNSATSSDYLRDIEMNWYGEVSVDTVTVTWSGIIPGSDFGDSTKQTDITVTYIANGNYYQKISASTTWSGGPYSAALNTSGTPGSMEFSLKGDDVDNLSSAVLITAYPSYVTINSAGTQTSELGDEVSTNTIWLKLGLILDATFTGTIYYMISSTS